MVLPNITALSLGDVTCTKASTFFRAVDVDITCYLAFLFWVFLAARIAKHSWGWAVCSCCWTRRLSIDCCLVKNCNFVASSGRYDLWCNIILNQSELLTRFHVYISFHRNVCSNLGDFLLRLCW